MGFRQVPAHQARSQTAAPPVATPLDRLREEYHESRRCSMDTHPESYVIKDAGIHEKKVERSTLSLKPPAEVVYVIVEPSDCVGRESPAPKPNPVSYIFLNPAPQRRSRHIGRHP